MSEDSQRKGFWGTTLNKLKSVLAKTKEQVSEEALQEQDSLAPNQTIPVAAKDVAATADADPAPTAAQPQALPVPSTATAVQSKSHRAVDEDYIESLEERLIKADLGLATVEPLVQSLRKESRGKNWTSENVDIFLQREFSSLLNQTSHAGLSFKAGVPNIYLIVGVNGVGKTTSIGKLAFRFKSEGKKVLLAAGDTFRAAAESQLEIWSQRAGVDIVRLADGADPGAVVYQALQKARADQYDVVLVDTAGRLHNKTNLMAELKKIRSVVEKNAEGMNVESLLVLDASTGQNGLQQAKVFSEVCGLTGVILTKLDGTAKGGVVFAIAKELKIPVKLIGLGEKMEDLRDFDAAMFVQALF
ncbi:signal recognition particle-docking protein FtsY [bacterium]|nr:signal recognition particle-docking protein FtsY [bacterium]MBP9809208.1 signal recognition particle-docking protein FtsY [bacterium]